MNSAINTTLEIINGNLALLRLEFLVFLVAYMWRQAKTRDVPITEWVMAVPLGVVVAASLFVNNVGEWGRNMVVWMWRFATDGKTPLTSVDLFLLGTFSMIAAVGLLAMIRIFSKPVFGSLPWVACVALSIVYTVATLFS